MAWILLLLALACFVVPYFTSSFALGAFCLVLALVLALAAMVLLLSARMGDASRQAEILSEAELQALREQAQAARQNEGARGVSAPPARDHPAPPPGMG